MRQVLTLTLTATLLSCASKPAPPTNPGAAPAALPATAPAQSTNDPTIVGGRVPPVLLPPPAIDLSAFTPDFHDELRWPLSLLDHPRLEPRFAIAAALAQSGIGLARLCSLGAQHRHGIDLDLQAYLRGWCSALAGDVDAACSELAPLIGSATPSISDAVKVDLANILADHGRADDAERQLNRHHIANIEIVDRLAANYVEVGTNDDALEMNRLAIESDANPTVATRCMRIAREILLVGSRDSLGLADLHELAMRRSAFARGDETCVKLDTKLRCWANGECEDFLAKLGTAPRKLEHLRKAHKSWSLAVTAADWHTIAELAASAVPTDGATAVVFAAFENELRTSGTCNQDQIDWLSDYLGVFHVGISRSPQLQQPYNDLWKHCRELASAKQGS